MKRVLKSKEIIYNINFDSITKENDKVEFEDEIFENIDVAFGINQKGFNIYLIDNCYNYRLKNLMKYIENLLQGKSIPGDICYVIKEKKDEGEVLYLKSGNGKKIENYLRSIKEEYYEIINKFYNDTDLNEKEELIDEIQKKRNDLIDKLLKKAEKKNLQIKTSYSGYSFIPIKDKVPIPEDEFDLLDSTKKDDIMKNVTELKKEAKEIIRDLKDIELYQVKELKELFNLYLSNETKKMKSDYRNELKEDINAIAFLEYICQSIEEKVIKEYTASFDDDDNIIKEIILGYDINVLFDSSEFDHPKVIYEDDPNINNLFGNIEYKNDNGNYTSDLSNVKSGSLIQANGGCLILNAEKLLQDYKAYYYLKKFLNTNELKINQNKNYLDLLSVSAIKLQDIKLDTKIFLIGSYEIFDILFNSDEEFKNLFKCCIQYNPVVDIDENTKRKFKDMVYSLIEENNYLNISDRAIKELAKYFSRKAESSSKLYLDANLINDILVYSNRNAIKHNNKMIESEDFFFPYQNMNLFEKEFEKYFKENKINICLNKSFVGQVNGLSVIDLNYYSFGKPFKVTCACYKGDGEIIDVQSESNLSGKIHKKSVNILRGLINEFVGGYGKLPINFNISFEQTYGLVDGDSASVAEFISMISSISRIPVKQSIAVTGSINQFGDIQSIGGINDKIEGFFKVCDYISTHTGKAVLMPNSNRDNLVLDSEIEAAIKKGEFNIYVMDNIKDAIEILMGDYDLVMKKVRSELEKYKESNRKE
ncbi:AAA family ATPase [Clostridium sp. DL1XJH146]